MPLAAMVNAGQGVARSLPRVNPKTVIQAVGRAVKKATPAADKPAEVAAPE
ncbi:MAG: hypothetical protein JNM92_09855 [Zoogloea sp.]|nr:hypothetical protein [Zoogloea sp.]